jgi:ParB family chromosome partitioning protein
MELQNILISKCFESSTNPRGSKFEGPEFDELVASVKEKGVLMPVLARPHSKGFEIVAGNRRFRAAKAAGLKELPARVIEMSDSEAREAQIVENLQRADVHPLEEGEAYRQLIEQSNYDVAAVAAKVGKDERYIRDRLALTNLIPAAQKKFRESFMHAGHAALVARLDDKVQKDALQYLEHEMEYGGTSTSATTKDLREWIHDRTLADSMKNPPWHGNEELTAALGGCEECKGKGGDLFGKRTADACSNPKCYANRLTAFINLKLAERPELVKLSGNWGTNSAELPTRGSYKVLSKKEKCDFAQEGIIVEGEGVGTILKICMDGDCAKHWGSGKRNGASTYKPTANELATRKRKAEADKKRKAKETESFQAALAKLAFPLSEKHLDALLEFALYRCGTSYQQPVVALLGLEAIKRAEKGYMDPKKTRMVRDYSATLRKYAEASNAAKLRVICGLLMPLPGGYGNEYAKAVQRL